MLPDMVLYCSVTKQALCQQWKNIAYTFLKAYSLISDQKTPASVTWVGLRHVDVKPLAPENQSDCHLLKRKETTDIHVGTR